MADVVAEATVVVGGQVDPSIGQDAENAVSGISTALDNVEDSSKRAKLGFKELGRGVTDLGTGLVATGLISQDTADKFSIVGDSVAGARGAFTALKGAASLASEGFGTAVKVFTEFPPVAKAVALGQRAINAAMSANPIGLVIAAIVLLVAAFVIAYKKSETFRNIVNAAFNGIKAAAQAVFGFITGYIKLQVGLWSAIFHGVERVFSGIWDGIKTAGVAAFGVLKTALNGIINGVNFAIGIINKIPHVNIPLIPKLATGVRGFSGGVALVGEQGPELVNLPRGSDVYSNAETGRMMGASVVNHIYGPTNVSDILKETNWALLWGSRLGGASRPVPA